jgi:hypothetical protein
MRIDCQVSPSPSTLRSNHADPSFTSSRCALISRLGSCQKSGIQAGRSQGQSHHTPVMAMARLYLGLSLNSSPKPSIVEKVKPFQTPRTALLIGKPCAHIVLLHTCINGKAKYCSVLYLISPYCKRCDPATPLNVSTNCTETLEEPFGSCAAQNMGKIHPCG